MDSLRNRRSGSRAALSAMTMLFAGITCSALAQTSNLPPVSPDPGMAPPAAPNYQRRPLRTGTQNTTLQTGTQNTTLQTGTQNTLLQTGTQNTTLQTGTASTMIQSGTQNTTLQSTIQKEAGPINILFLIDASFSMKEKLPGGSMQKMDAAKQVMQNALSRIPSDVNLGLRVFGQGFTNDPFIDCKQTALLVPLGQGNRRSIVDRVRQIHPYGLTPLEYALRQAAESDFAGVEGTKTLILITDGADTCGGDPCAFIRQLPRMGIKLKVDAVGLDLKREPGAKDQLNCLTKASGGKYYDANTAADLIESVSHSINSAVSGRVIIRPGTPAKNTETPPELQEMTPLKR